MKCFPVPQLELCLTSVSAKTTGNPCYKDMLYAYCSCKFLRLLILYFLLTPFRVPIYSISSWTSILSIKVASFVEPVRDVYEVCLHTMPPGLPADSIGIYNLYLLPAAHQLSRWRKSLDNYDAWPRASASFMASESFPSQG